MVRVPVARQEGCELGHCEMDGAVLYAKGLYTGPKWVGSVSSVLVVQVAALAEPSAPYDPAGVEGGDGAVGLASAAVLGDDFRGWVVGVGQDHKGWFVAVAATGHSTCMLV